MVTMQRNASKNAVSTEKNQPQEWIKEEAG